ncbi:MULTISPECIES: DUF2237 family protein [Haloarcula]|uniref:DUF2237 family protein n=1 Tax=Haloarcula TaxID=2237 RepID=UPI000F8C933A|nr:MULTISPECIES: DUF2237 domain-containing protein [Haloarcula]NHX38249.1 DUF2237 domain-containing protein [Haloarcula sp. R1-2]
MESERNVLGGELAPCSMDPETGFIRDGYCYPLQRDPGRHEICAVMTAEFLEYSKAQGNDLVTPRPELNFPGLDPGDSWCVCVPRWIEAHEAGRAPPVNLDATSEDVLEDVSLETLQEYAADGDSDADATAE